MFSIRDLLLQQGYLFLFSYVFLVQAGIPIPSDPLLLVMGALAGDHLYNFWLALAAAVLAGVSGDFVWYELGRRRGRSILKLLCRFSIEPDTCVSKTEAKFGKRGAGTLFFAKFVPGVSLVAMPLSGMIRMPRWRFLLFDAAGTGLWAGSYLFVGYLFHKQVNAVILWLGLLGHRAGAVVGLLIGGYIGFKYFQRWRMLRELRINRISPEDAHQLLLTGKPVTVVDLRHPAEVARDRLKIAGAMVIRPDELRSRSGEIPREQEIILYCT